MVAERRGEVVEGSWEEIDEQAVGALSHGVGRAGRWRTFVTETPMPRNRAKS